MPLFYDVVTPAAVGTGVTRAAIDATYRVPSAARELVAVYPWITAEAPAPAEAIMAVWDIIGTDYRFQPCEGLCPVASGKLGAIDQTETTPIVPWKIHAPLNGTEVLNMGVEPLSALAANGQAGFTMVYSDVPTGRQTIYGKSSREVATGTAAGTITAGTSLTVSNAIMLHEIWAAVTTGAGVVTADEELVAYATMNCTQFSPIQTVSFYLEPIHGIEATSGCSKVKSIVRLPCDLRFKATQATVDASLTQYDIITNAGVYAHGFRYIGTRP